MPGLSMKLGTALAALGLLAACAELPTPAPVYPTQERLLQPGPIPDGTLFIRDERGRVLFSAPSKSYGRGQEIQVQAYAHIGVLNASIEQGGQEVVRQRLRANDREAIGIFYNRQLGGFKVRNALHQLYHPTR